MSVWCSQLLPGQVHLNPGDNSWVMDAAEFIPVGWLPTLQQKKGTKPLPLFPCGVLWV